MLWSLEFIMVCLSGEFTVTWVYHRCKMIESIQALAGFRSDCLFECELRYVGWFLLCILLFLYKMDLWADIHWPFAPYTRLSENVESFLLLEVLEPQIPRYITNINPDSDAGPPASPGLHMVFQLSQELWIVGCKNQPHVSFLPIKESPCQIWTLSPS